MPKSKGTETEYRLFGTFWHHVNGLCSVRGKAELVIGTLLSMHCLHATKAYFSWKAAMVLSCFGDKTALIAKSICFFLDACDMQNLLLSGNQPA